MNDLTVSLIQNLIKIESISKNEAPLVSFFAGWLEERFPSGSVTVNDRNISIVLTGKKFKANSSISKTLLLCSHYDTVPVCSGWTKDPFGAQITDGKIFGLGANDALASVCCMTVAALEKTADILSGNSRVVLSFVCEEELGGNGFARMEPLLPKYDYAIFGEPTSLRIGYCMRGSMKLKVFVRGKACHASRPHQGENASWKLSDALNKIQSIPLTDTSPWGTATLEPVKITGGSAENQIPDRIEILLDSRPTTERSNDYIIDALKKTGLEFEIIRNLRRPQAIDVKHELIELIQKSLSTSIGEREIYPFGGSCDMAFSTAPSVIFGPGASERSHAADEFITIEELSEGVKAYINLLTLL